MINGFQKDENGKVSWGMIAPGFKDYLALMNKWYEKGYISKDFANQVNTNTMFDNSEIGTYYDAIVATYNRGQRYGATIVAAPYPRLDENQKLLNQRADSFHESLDVCQKPILLPGPGDPEEKPVCGLSS